MPKNVKNTTLVGPLDLLAPHSCMGCGCIGNVLCDRCKKNLISHHINLCPNCKVKISAKTGNCPDCPDLPPTFIVDKRSSLIGTLVHNYKYHSARALARTFAEILDSLLPNFTSDVIVVPLPTISRHIRARGLDHTRLIAKRLAKLRHYQTRQLLTRSTNTVQVGTNRTTRIKQASTAYQISPKAKINPTTTYLLLDDVWTTGASMRSAIGLLKSAGAQNIAVSILALSE